MKQDSILDFDLAFKYTGQLFLETRHELEKMSSVISHLENRIRIIEQERDDALRMLSLKTNGKESQGTSS